MPIPVISTAIAEIKAGKINEIWYRYFFGQSTDLDALTASVAAITPTYGTWTPTLITDGVAFTSVTYDPVTGGRYSKIGSLVHIQGTLSTDAVTKGAASGSIGIGGLPFTASASTGGTDNGYSGIALGNVVAWLTVRPLMGRVQANTNYIVLAGRTTADGDNANTTVADVSTAADSNFIRIGGTYLTDE